MSPKNPEIRTPPPDGESRAWIFEHSSRGEVPLAVMSIRRALAAVRVLGVDLRKPADLDPWRA